jgi:hypothetical protein
VCGTVYGRPNRRTVITLFVTEVQHSARIHVSGDTYYSTRASKITFKVQLTAKKNSSESITYKGFQTCSQYNVFEQIIAYTWGTRRRSWLRQCATSQKTAGSIPDGAIGIFHCQSFRPHYGLGFDPDSNRNQYQEYFLGVKVAGA